LADHITGRPEMISTEERQVFDTTRAVIEKGEYDTLKAANIAAARALVALGNVTTVTPIRPFAPKTFGTGNGR
jgi:hypothetical protein